MVVGTPTEDTSTSKQADTVGARNTKINSITSKIRNGQSGNNLVDMWLE